MSSVTGPGGTVTVVVWRDEPRQRVSTTALLWPLDAVSPVAQTGVTRLASGRLTLEWTAALQAVLEAGGVLELDSDCEAVIPSRVFVALGWDVGPHSGADRPFDRWVIHVAYQEVTP